MADMTSLTAEGWPRRVFLMGVVMAFAIGIPVGALLAFGSPREELPGQSPLLMMLIFIVLTAVWTIPGAFFVRWRLVKAYRERGMGGPGGPDAAP
jgi:hypothetical protein